MVGMLFWELYVKIVDNGPRPKRQNYQLRRAAFHQERVAETIS